jgi:hypothetical protein
MNVPTLNVTRTGIIAIAALCVLLLCMPGAMALTVKLDPIASQHHAVSSASSALMASANDNYPISEEQAKNNIRVFVGNLSLEPELYSTGSMEIGNYYYFATDDSTFVVNQNSGVVEFVHFGANEAGTPDIVLTHDQALAAAKEYAGTKYDSFSTRNWKLVIDQIDTDYDWVYNKTSQDWSQVERQKTYDFVFREQKDSVLLPNLVHVSINPVSGAVIDYWGVDRLLTVSDLTSKVSLSKATAAAEDYVYSEFVTTSSEGYLAVIIRSQNVEDLAWVIKLHGHYTGSNYESTYEIVVSAKDGSVIGLGWDQIWPEHQLYYY